MVAMSKSAPGTPAALLDVTIRSVTEGRYRYAMLHLVWLRDRISLDEVAELVNRASTIPEMPWGLTAADVIANSRPSNLPAWLNVPLDDEITRICSGLPVASSLPAQLVGRIAAAVCVDVFVDTADAAVRAAHDGDPDEPNDAGEPTAHRSRMIHLTVPDLISIEDDELSDSGRSANPHS